MMDKLRQSLSRKVGPFSVGVWIIIVVVGIGIGLLVRRNFTGGGGPGGGATEEDTEYYVPPRGSGYRAVGGGAGGSGGGSGMNPDPEDGGDATQPGKDDPREPTGDDETGGFLGLPKPIPPPRPPNRSDDSTPKPPKPRQPKTWEARLPGGHVMRYTNDRPGGAIFRASSGAPMPKSAERLRVVEYW